MKFYIIDKINLQTWLIFFFLYFYRVQEYPESAPKIDWAHYKKLIAVPGMVDTFQKHYESMKIPFPADNYTKVLDAQEKDIVRKIIVL